MKVDEVVTVSRDGGTAVVRLCRPEVLNALDPALVSALTGAVTDAAADHEVTAVVLVGSGRAFSSGADLRALAAMSDADLADYLAGIQALADAVRTCAVPTIAAVRGAAIGGGLELAANCDARIAAVDATFACPEVAWGLTMTNGSSRLIRDLVGDGWARELLLFGTRIDARTAARIGLVTRVVADQELEPLALGMAARVADAVGPSVIATKRLLNREPGPWPALLDAELAEVGALGGEALRRRIAAALA